MDICKDDKNENVRMAKKAEREEKNVCLRERYKVKWMEN